MNSHFFQVESVFCDGHIGQKNLQIIDL